MATLRFSGHAADQRGITHRYKNDVRRWYLVQDFTGDRGGARRNERIARIVEKIVAVLARKLCGAFTRCRSTHGASLDYFCTKRDYACAFHGVWIFLKTDRGSDCCQSCCVS